MRWFSPVAMWTQVTMTLKNCRTVRQIINQTYAYPGSTSPGSHAVNFTVACADYTRCVLQTSCVDSSVGSFGIRPTSNTQFTINSDSTADFDVYVTGVEYW